jgi:CrcB protein
VSLALPVVMGIAGGLGALARYAAAEWTAQRWMGRFPLATFCINMTGAFALGLLMTAHASPASGLTTVRLVLGTGFLGGYTTFSALSFETYALARSGHTGHAWINGLAALVCGVGAVGLGVWVGRLL